MSNTGFYSTGSSTQLKQPKIDFSTIIQSTSKTTDYKLYIGLYLIYLLIFFIWGFLDIPNKIIEEDETSINTFIGAYTFFILLWCFAGVSYFKLPKTTMVLFILTTFGLLTGIKVIVDNKIKSEEHSKDKSKHFDKILIGYSVTISIIIIIYIIIQVRNYKERKEMMKYEEQMDIYRDRARANPNFIKSPVSPVNPKKLVKPLNTSQGISYGYGESKI